ncbi:PREDICTED: uncharacterized protein K02A2.6-like [Priapulus caudatus]|uniref:RNA-directed DNA polymerase n=1 Tax=Priapulus caudatus TaxID=37621 RepID=A0ABM1F238_PRICU|nr:PREDICTED: uncharacterized protein K02A2.6-like [Priapulus caudatus]
MVTYLAKFVPDLSTETAPLRSLLHHKTQWEWQHEHEKAWTRFKDLLSSEPVLKFYDPKRQIKMSTDASQSGLGAYIYGQSIIAETDHKPLVFIFAKSLADCPPRIQRLKLRLQKYDLKITYTPGKHMYAADTLSRAYMKDTGNSDIDIEVQAYIDGVKSTTSVSESRMKEIQDEMQKDADLQLLMVTILSGWPNDRVTCPSQILEYWNYRDELSVIDGIIFKGSRILIPKKLRSEMLKKIHVGHLGIEKCRKRAREVLFWPMMNSDIANVVKDCEHYLTHRSRQQVEPLDPHPIVSRPWEKVATDLFSYSGRDYLLVVDAYSNYPEVAVLSNATSRSVINSLKSTFARHGVPEDVFGDNGPCYDSAEFKQFSEDWGFRHTTSSPRYPNSNGLAERTVQTVKNIIRKSKESGEDPQLGLLAYRSTPMENGYSPAQMLMGRRIRTNLPIRTNLLETNTSQRVVKKKVLSQKKQKHYHDRGTKQLPALEPSSRVRVLSDDGKIWREKGLPSSWLYLLVHSRLLKWKACQHLVLLKLLAP